MATADEIEHFLRDFKQKLDFWGLFIRSDRGKNFSTLTALEFSTLDVKRELKGLEKIHYSEGPIPETLYNNADMWVFGKVIQGKEVYIKISLGLSSQQVICISFHFSEYTMNYPFN